MTHHYIIALGWLAAAAVMYWQDRRAGAPVSPWVYSSVIIGSVWAAAAP